MNSRTALSLALALAAAASTAAQSPMGTAFTYQGQLRNAGVPVHNTADFIFSLWDAADGGLEVANAVQATNVEVSRGLFTVIIDFGVDPFAGEARWLQIAARTPAGGGEYTTLAPRQELTPAPYALHAGTAASGWGGGTAGRIPKYLTARTLGDSVLLESGGRVGVGLTSPAAQLDVNTSAQISAGSEYASLLIGGTRSTPGEEVGGLHFYGHHDHIVGQAPYGHITAEIGGGGVWPRGALLFYAQHDPSIPPPLVEEEMRINPDGKVGIGVAAPEARLHVAGSVALRDWLGTVTDGPLELRLNNTRAMLFQPHANCPNIIGGNSANTAAAGICGATVAGGGAAAWPNQVTDDYGTVGGGLMNTAGEWATIGGGSTNQATGLGNVIAGGGENATSGFWATLGGGEHNAAHGDGATVAGGTYNQATSEDATVAGGEANVASGAGSAVGGGAQNTASGDWATVAGGYGNTASWNCAFTGGGQYNLASGPGSVALGGFSNEASNSTAFACGRRAKARHFGTFVWGDYSVDADFISSGNNQFLIRAAGGVGIGTNTPAGFQLAVNGSAAKPGGGSWSVLSDARLKTDVRPLTGALEKLLALRGVSFEYRADAGDLALPGRQTGLIAQEVQTVFPDWVAEDARGYKYVTARGLEALVVEALRDLRQEKDAQIAAQAGEIRDLRETVGELQTRLESIEAHLAKRTGAQGGGR